MLITTATETDLISPKYDRRRDNKGRTPLVSIDGWEAGTRLDVSSYLGEEAAKVARSVRSQAKKRGWAIREISWNVFVRFPVYAVLRDGVWVGTVPARNAEEACSAVSHGATGNWSAVLQE